MTQNNYTHGAIVPLIGGLPLGTEKAFGSKPEYILSYSAFGANDAQYRAYHDDIPYYRIDLNEVPSTLKAVDVIGTTCPCAGLSMLSRNSNAESETNNWMFESANYVLKNIMPKVFWGENAPGLYGSMGVPVVEKLRKIAEKYSYTLLLYKTRSNLHGIGQVRNRSFYFFFKDEDTPIFDYFEKPMTSMEDIIRNAYVSEDDPMNQLVNDKKPSDDPWYQYILEELEGGISHVEFFKKLESSTNAISYIQKVDGTFAKAKKWFSENGHDSKALRCEVMDKKLAAGGAVMKRGTEFGKGCTSAFVAHFATMLVHPDEDRYISIREALSIMKMPSDFQLQGGRKNLNMICQNVPVCTAQDMAENILKYLDGHLDSIHTDFIKQNNTNKSIEYVNHTSTLDQFFVDTK